MTPLGWLGRKTSTQTNQGCKVVFFMRTTKTVIRLHECILVSWLSRIFPVIYVWMDLCPRVAKQENFIKQDAATYINLSKKKKKKKKRLLLKAGICSQKDIFFKIYQNDNGSILTHLRKIEHKTFETVICKLPLMTSIVPFKMPNWYALTFLCFSVCLRMSWLSLKAPTVLTVSGNSLTPALIYGRASVTRLWHFCAASV